MNKVLKQYAILISCIFMTNNIFAQLDASFNSTGELTIEKNTTYNTKASALQSDGKIVLVGSTGDSAFVVRINSNGTIDNSFGINGYVHLSKLSATSISVNTVQTQTDGKLVIGGRYNTASDNRSIIIRLNVDGSLDNTFDMDGYAFIWDGATLVYIPNDLQILPDGKLIVLTYNSIFRLTASGSLDNTYDTDGIFSFNTPNLFARKFAIQSDGKALVTGSKNTDSFIMRANANGGFDNGFGTNGIKTIDVGQNDLGKSIINLESGKILVGGNTGNSIYLMRLNTSDGSIDNTYDSDGIATFDFPGATVSSCSAIQEDTVTNDILIGAATLYSAWVKFSLMRASATATAEAFATINIGGSTIAEPFAIHIQADRKIILTGEAINPINNKYNTTAARFVADFSTSIANVEDVTTLTNGINLFPNPASHIVNIHSAHTIQYIKVLDVLGHEVLTDEANGNTQLDISSLPKGLYTFLITTDKGVGSKKVSVW